MEDLDLFGKLSQGCVSHILSFTSPRDACRSSAVCSIFRSASESDVVWEGFLPSDYRDIIARSSPPLQFSSKKELFFRLCDPIIIDEDNMSFSIEKMTGKKCFMLSARNLKIAWGETPMYWRWTSFPESRFQEVAELLEVCWLDIRGMIDAHILSPKTTYKAYLVHKVGERVYGLTNSQVETLVKLGGHASEGTAFLQSVSSRSDVQVPQARSDGWMEIEMGEFFNDEGEEGDVEMSLMEVRHLNWKSGLIIEGIEVRPVCK